MNWVYNPQFLYLHELGLLPIFFLLNGLHLWILYFVRLDFVCQKLIYFHKIAKIIVLIMELCEYLKFWNLSKLDIKLFNFSCLRSKMTKMPLTKLTKSQTKSKFSSNAKLHLFMIKLIFLIIFKSWTSLIVVNPYLKKKWYDHLIRIIYGQCHRYFNSLSFDN